MLALGSVTSIFAQYNRGESREVVLGRPGRTTTIITTSPVMSPRDRDEQIRRINWRFDNEIMNVRHDRFLRGRERRRQISVLEAQRQEQIRLVNMRFVQSQRDRRIYRDRY